MPGLQPVLDDIRNRLGKKTSFEAAVLQLTELVKQQAQCADKQSSSSSSEACIPAASSPDQKQLYEVLTRCFTLLKTRYTAPAFWQAGHTLFQAARGVAADTKQLEQLYSYEQDCVRFLADSDLPVPPSASVTHQDQPAIPVAHDADAPLLAAQAEVPSRGHATARPFLFEGQLTSQSDAPVRRSSYLESFVGDIIQRSQQVVEATSGAGAEASPGQSVDQLVELLEQGNGIANLRALLDQVQGLATGLEGDGDADLHAALLASMEQAGHAGPPPASKAAVSALEREQLTGARLAQLGGEDTRCSVCLHNLAVGETVQVMPCSSNHVFHPPCLAPWLEAHNSCPVCRHELPTDDMEYERRKVHDANEAEERRGAENALSHNEFMYT